MAKTHQAKASFVISAGRVRLRSRDLCSIPKVTAILDVAGFPLDAFLESGGRIERRTGDRAVYITPGTPASWSARDRQIAILALFRMGLHVHVLAWGKGARRGRGGHVELRVVPGGSLS